MFFASLVGEAMLLALVEEKVNCYQYWWPMHLCDFPLIVGTSEPNRHMLALRHSTPIPVPKADIANQPQHHSLFFLEKSLLIDHPRLMR